MRPWICLALLAACGDDPHTTIDAPMHVGDTQPIDAPDVHPVTCTPSGSTGQVTVDGPTSSDPVQVTFVVHDPSGAVVSRSATMGSDATAMLDVPACGMVSVVQVDSFGTEVLTFTAVQPGDHLVHTGRSAPAVERAVDVTVPAQTGATGYQVTAVCSSTHLEFASGPNPGVFHMTPACTSSSVSVVATAQTATKPISIATVALAASGTTTITLPAFSQPAVTTLTTHGLAYTSGLYATFAKPSGNLLLLGYTNGTITGGAATLTAPITSGEGGIEIELDGPGSGTWKQHAVLVRGVAAFPTSVDLAPADLLPPVTASIDTATTRPTVTWSTTAQAAAALFEVHVGDASWNLVAPAISGAVRYPDLPADLWASGTPVLTGAGVIESSAVTTYNANNFALVMQNFPATGTQLRETFIDQPSSNTFARHAWRGAR